MIFLTKLNGEEFVVNCEQIQMIELIPESKVVLMNKEFFIVRETAKEIIDKSVDYGATIINRARAGAIDL
ncbi:MAG: flagellar FlbD family protein [Clostridiales bacterium]|nr:flagellar FlbD family protein [Clostridiales bacterium]